MTKKIISILLALALTLSIGAASAQVIPLQGWDGSGKKVTLAVPEDCRIILVELWEPWCGLCLQAMTELNRLYEKYRDQGLMVVGMYSDREYDGVTSVEMAERLGLSYPNLRIAGQKSRQLAGDGYPTLWVLDRYGEVLPLTRAELTSLLLANGCPEEMLDYSLSLNASGCYSGYLEKGWEEYVVEKLKWF